ncbi:hypothetical protein [Sphingobium sp. D43FB]|uniref:hypothetical protein n=1 Tax=Sphingobium sp. D43FB TaxID=2017595 RepID=UPI000BB58A72|nr:hypothetical protein [Sphingobium sp. D43FB]PBN42918.1 hypothetical protein SxD43FB_13875 [Sphingobium sp. D43FB]
MILPLGCRLGRIATFATGAEALLTDIGCPIVTTDSILHASNVVALGPLLGGELVDQLTVLDANDYVKHPNETLTGKG